MSLKYLRFFKSHLKGTPTGDKRPPTGGRLRVTLSMIVRDEEAHLPRCLRSVADLMDEVVVVDTGSTDRTREIARSFGAQVFDEAWSDDFAAARNAALDRATGDYVFSIDADEWLDTQNRQRLRGLIAGLADDGAVYTMHSLSLDANDEHESFSDEQVRLFPNRAGARWSYRLHEQILPAFWGKAEVRRSGVTIDHSGYSDRSMWEVKRERNQRILAAMEREQPEHPVVLFNIGRAALVRGECRPGLDYLQRSLAKLPTDDPLVRDIYHLIVAAYAVMGDQKAALEASSEGLALDPEDARLLHQEAVIRYDGGDADGARECWLRIVGSTDGTRFVNSDTYLVAALRGLALLAQGQGASLKAFKYWSMVRAKRPADPEVAAALFESARSALSSPFVLLRNKLSQPSSSSDRSSRGRPNGA
jgi:tetratricopeptide (TPR) repeat protein